MEEITTHIIGLCGSPVGAPANIAVISQDSENVSITVKRAA